MAKITIEQKKADRLEEWKTWISSFLELNDDNPESEYITIDYAAELVNDYYWRLALDFLKGLLEYSEEEEEHNLHYYKIISASELTVMAVMPFTYKQAHPKEKRKKLNAEFAFYVATSIMLNWKIKGIELTSVDDLKKVVMHHELIDIDDKGNPVHYSINFRDEHIDWLRDLNTAGPLPILSNSQTWRLCFLAATAVKENAGKL